jgi:aminoglycoside phosphotransferase (APT) family kinase protein
MLTATGTIGVRHGFAADPALPHRDLLLDQDAAREHLTSLLGRPVDDCDLVRVKYRIGESLRVTYRVRIDGRVELRTVRAFPGGGSGPAYRKAAGAGVLHDPALDAVWWTFPHDRRLRDLDDLLRPAPDLAALAPGWRAGELVEYSPERAATFRAVDADGHPVAFAKAYAPGTVDVVDRAGRYARIAAVLDGGGISSPVPLGTSVARTVLVMQPMPGVRWGELDGTALVTAVRRLGTAVATLHGSGDRAAAGLPRFGRLEVRRVVHSAHLVAIARPDVAARATRLADRLADGPPPGDAPVTLHGDCHPKNALDDGHRLMLIDLDQAGTGAAAADLGSFLARLRVATITGQHTATEERSLAATFVTGYAGNRPVPSCGDLAWHTAAALIAEQAVRAVNRVRPAVLSQLTAVVDAACGVLA